MTSQWIVCIGIIPARAGFTSGAGEHRRTREDHPRSRGVYQSTYSSHGAAPGSSPLARGLHDRRTWMVGAPGIIPARAGFTAGGARPRRIQQDHPRSRGVYSGPRAPAAARPGSSPLARGLRPRPRPRSGGREDHPRSRGVYGLSRRATSRLIGSSPLARGLQAPQGQQALQVRIIPARAGFTSWTITRTGAWTDHPRSRGVYMRPGTSTSPAGGSSPLARGLRPRDRAPITGRRIIPARAGFTLIAGREPPPHGDHPRSRGVYRSRWGRPGTRRGSSPLARGLLASSGGDIDDLGIIPARAGFTRRTRRRQRRRRDHPRSRGVYDEQWAIEAAQEGSSPLARGLPRWAQWRRPLAGIIPARAGFTTRPCLTPRRCRDHPRSRGVYPGPGAVAAPGTGSSPLARGLRRRGSGRSGGTRIIPARAGFTSTAAMLMPAW